MTLLGRSLLLVSGVVLACLLAVAFAVVFAGRGGGELGATPTGPAMKAPSCFPAGAMGVCRSPDGVWLARVGSGRGCSIYLSRAGKSRWVRMFRSDDAYCSELTWGKPHQLLFEVGDSCFYTLDPAIRYPVTRPAAFAEFMVSPDRRWVAGDDANGAPEAPQRAVYLLTPDASTCLMVPLGPHRTDEVVGFTSDSKALIVSSAPWNGTSAPAGVTRVREFRLSSLHTVCNGSELVG